MFESLSNLVNKGKDAVVNSGIDKLARGPVNKYMEGILEVQSIQLPKITFTLAGLPGQVFTVEAGMINISESGDKVMIGDFSSDTEFVRNALNKFVPKVIEVDDPKIQAALRVARGTLQR
ncbi:MAG: hypothetical protein Q3990_06470 [Desulfovibrionaceae bacterium]|nr:hypothetical protein [Desulfovibrionaceae bacterium]